jgi:hypothetical protein
LQVPVPRLGIRAFLEGDALSSPSGQNQSFDNSTTVATERGPARRPEPGLSDEALAKSETRNQKTLTKSLAGWPTAVTLHVIKPLAASDLENEPSSL